MEVDKVAAQMLEKCVSEGQSARRVDVAADIAPLRKTLRQLARAHGVSIRTALLEDVVVVARTDADLWNDDRDTMRAKLTPPPSEATPDK